MTVAEDDTRAERLEMVARQIAARGILDPRVLDAMREVPRHRFLPPDARGEAYRDGPVSIGEGQTISQPYIVALMTDLIEPHAQMRALEIGTGSGYQTAVLSRCVGELFTVEILPALARGAAELLAELGCSNVHARIGDGADGWPEQAPYGAIVVTAAPRAIPQALLDQLDVGGRLVVPLGASNQDLVLVTRTADGFSRRSIAPVRFVPMTGKSQG